MASDQGFVDYVLDQAVNSGIMSCRKMFGEYAVYCNGKVVALVCDNRLFVKPTEGGRKFAVGVTLAPAYPGSKPFLLIEDQLDDRNWIGELIRITERELPEPKQKKGKSKTRSGRKNNGKYR